MRNHQTAFRDPPHKCSLGQPELRAGNATLPNSKVSNYSTTDSPGRTGQPLKARARGGADDAYLASPVAHGGFAIARIKAMSFGTSYSWTTGLPDIKKATITCIMSTPVGSQAVALKVLLEDGEESVKSFLKLFIVEIPNANTREAYARAVANFLGWCHARGLHDLTEIRPMQVSDWMAELERSYSLSMIKQRLMAVRYLFEWLVTGQQIAANPAQAVRAPSQSLRTKRSPASAPQDAWRLLTSIPGDTISGKRDRALVGLLIYSLARVGAILALEARDVYAREGRLWVHLQKKSGGHQDTPCHEPLKAYLEAYLEAIGPDCLPRSPLFRTIGRGTGQLTENPLPPSAVYMMIQRRAHSAGIETALGSHNFRATGIAAYFKNDET